MLVRIDWPATGLHPTAWSGGFIADGKVPEFGGGILGSDPPEDAPAMRELVARGLAALPELLGHLDDCRQTGLTVSAFAGGTEHQSEYDPRVRTANRRLRNLERQDDEHWSRQVDEYTVSVGDVCFVLVGQVVNRRLTAVRYQPSGCLVVNSPVATPTLAEAAQGDWGRLTAEEFRLHLFADALAGDDGARARLAFYFPATARRLPPRATN